MTAAVRLAPRTTRGAAATEALGEALAPALAVGDVLVLEGPLGAGKTRFVAGLARGLAATARVRSPSFTLVNEYSGRIPLIHLDLYRLDPRDVPGLGLDELVARGVLAVEWGERLPTEWRDEALTVRFEPVDGDARVLHASAAGRRGGVLLAAWGRLPEPRA